MQLCYLINQYPKVSHSFIRREILELENQGARVLRVALRGWDQPVVDPLDVAELEHTRYVLKRGAVPVLGVACLYFLRHPRLFLRALGEARALNRTSSKAWYRHLFCLLEAAVVARWVREAGARHIHAHFGTNSAEVALLASQLSGVPYSFTVHGPEEFDSPQGLSLRQKAHRAARTIAISSYGRSQLYRWAAMEDWRRIAVVHCGLDHSFLGEQHATPSLSRGFVCVGRLCEQKGQLLLLESLRRVVTQGHDCHLVLAGDGEMRAEVEHKIRELDLSSHVTITGWISGDEVKRHILASRALVLPSFAEGLPVVLMEAMALSRPVITTYVAGIPELVMQPQCGWLTPSGDAGSLAAAMIDCLQSSAADLAAKGEYGRQRVLERHDIRTEASKLLALFRQGASSA